MNVYVPPIIEKVYNIQGSTAAPGSGEYHRYRALRRRERTIAAVLEKEYKEKEEQKKFEEQKEKIKSQIEQVTQKKKKRRDRKKLIKKLFKEAKKKTTQIEKNELLQQVKDELNYNDIILNDKKDDINNISNYYEEEDNAISPLAPNLSAIELNKESVIKRENNNKDYINNDLKKLFPIAKKKEIEFENFEDYEDHLEEMNIREELEKKEQEKNKIKIKQVEDIIIHEED